MIRSSLRIFISFVLVFFSAGIVCAENLTPNPDASTTVQSPKDTGEVWQVTRAWSLEEEERYSDWVRTRVDAEFFERHKIVTDCADVPYALRFIYARIRGLPQGCHYYKGAKWGHWSRAFAHLPTHVDWTKDERFRAALSHVLYDITLVRSLPWDTYPIDPRAEAGQLRVGSVFANTHHAGIVFNIEPAAFFPVLCAYSTMPPRIRQLVLVNFDESLTYDDIDYGLLNWTWWRRDTDTGEWETVPKETMPGYSLWQYDHPENLASLVQYEYRMERDGEEDPLGEMLASLRTAIDLRIGVVRDGYAAYANRQKESWFDYDSWSTPGRDGRIQRKFEDMEDLARRGVFDEDVLINRLASEVIRAPGVPEMTFLEFRHALRTDTVSGEPWDPPTRRWGLLPGLRLRWMRRVGREITNLELDSPGDRLIVWRGTHAVATVDLQTLQVTPGKELGLDLMREGIARRKIRKRYDLNSSAPTPTPVSDGGLVVAQISGELSHYTPGRDTPMWTTVIDSDLYARPAVHERQVFVPATDGALYAFDLETGKQAWRLAMPDRFIRGAVPGADGDLWLAGSRSLRRISPGGSVRWATTLPDVIYASPGVDDAGRAYVGALDNRVHAFDAQGRKIWDFQTLSSVLVQPLVDDDGRVYAMATSGWLFCLETR